MKANPDVIAQAATNWRKHQWPAAEAMQAATSITRAHQLLVGRIDAVLAPLALNFSRFEVLALLFFTKTGQMPLGKIGDRLQVHPASVTNTVTRLTKDGFVKRVAHPSDGRTTLAVLTVKGRHRVEKAAAVLGEIQFGVSGLKQPAAREVTEAIAGLRQAAGDFD